MKLNRILVTGGSGFLGFMILKLLREHNYIGISYQRHFKDELKDQNFEQFLGDLCDEKALKMALQNVDAVIHCASKVGMSLDKKSFIRANLYGTQTLVKVMKEMKINKLIYTSTPSVIFSKDDVINGNEDIPYPNKFYSHYAYSKMLAEKFVLESADDNFYVIALRPHLIFGKGDQNLIPRVIESRKLNRLKIIGDGNNLVDVIPVHNAALAHIFALEKISKEFNKKVYFIGQGPVNLWNFINQTLYYAGLRPIDKKIPTKVAFVIGYIIEKILTIFLKLNTHPPMSRFIALSLGKSHYFDHKRSLSELGNYHQVGIHETLKSIFVDN